MSTQNNDTAKGLLNLGLIGAAVFGGVKVIEKVFGKNDMRENPGHDFYGSYPRESNLIDLVKFFSRKDAQWLSEVSDTPPFDDNGGEPDGNAWLGDPRWLSDSLIEQAINEERAVMVKGREVEYDPDEKQGEDDWEGLQAKFRGFEWIGYQHTFEAYVAEPETSGNIIERELEVSTTSMGLFDEYLDKNKLIITERDYAEQKIVLKIDGAGWTQSGKAQETHYARERFEWEL